MLRIAWSREYVDDVLIRINKMTMGISTATKAAADIVAKRITKDGEPMLSIIALRTEAIVVGISKPAKYPCAALVFASFIYILMHTRNTWRSRPIDNQT